MYRIGSIGLALIVMACTPQTSGKMPMDSRKGQFDVIRDGVNVDALMIQCAENPKAAGFPTTQACFDHAGKLLKKDR